MHDTAVHWGVSLLQTAVPIEPKLASPARKQSIEKQNWTITYLHINSAPKDITEVSAELRNVGHSAHPPRSVLPAAAHIGLTMCNVWEN